MDNIITEPFAPGTMGSKRFRIPSIITTKKNKIVAACDARWSHGLDSAGNLETVTAISKDGGRSWERQFVNHFDDVEDGSERCIFSAGFIDPIMGEDSQGNLYLLADLCPAFVGAYAVDGVVCGQQNGGRHPNGRLALKDGEGYSHGEPLELDEETYPYYVGEPEEDGYLPVLRLKDGGPYEDYVLDDEMYLYRRRESGVERVMIPQLNGQGEPTAHKIHANIFFAASPVKAYPSFHIVCRVSQDEGRTWSRLTFVSEQIGGRGFTAVCPGRGYSCWHEGKERMLFPIYDNNLGVEFASVIYTEDLGVTWKRGKRARETGFRQNGDYVKSSESQIVGMPDGSLRMFSRNLIQEITYTDSRDGGETWSAYKREPQLHYCGNCMVSVINYSRRIEGRPVLLASYPQGDGVPYHRMNGVIAVGLVDEGTGEVDWKYHYPVNQAPFYYSCLTELPDGKVLLWYEYEEYAIRCGVYTIEELLGLGKKDIGNKEVDDGV